MHTSLEDSFFQGLINHRKVLRDKTLKFVDDFIFDHRTALQSLCRNFAEPLELVSLPPVFSTKVSGVVQTSRSVNSSLSLGLVVLSFFFL